jgi:DnaJ-class molecular chaperone
MLVKKYHPDVNQDPDSTENITNLTRVYEQIKDQPVMFKPQQTGEKKTTEEEVEDYMEDANTEEEIKNALGLLVSTYFVRNVPEEYDTPDYTVDDQIVNQIYDQLEETKRSSKTIANLINLYCGKYIRENY